MTQTTINDFFNSFKKSFFDAEYSKASLDVYAKFFRSILRVYEGILPITKECIKDTYFKQFGKVLGKDSNDDLSRQEIVAKKICNTLILFLETGYLKPNNLKNKTMCSAYDSKILDAYIADCNEKDLSPNTIKITKGQINRFLCAFPLETATKEKFYDYLTRKERSKSILNLGNEERRFLTYCYKSNYLDKSIYLVIPKTKKYECAKVPSAYSLEEIRTMMNFMQSDKYTSNNKKRNYLAFIIFTVTGLRNIDAVNLKFENFDFGKHELSLIQSKTQKRITIKITPIIEDALIDYVKNERIASTSKYLFISSKGIPIVTFNYEIDKIIRDSGIQINGRSHGCHCLRHSLATLLINREFSMFQVAQVLGHSNTNTVNVYAKLNITELSKCCLEVKIYE